VQSLEQRYPPGSALKEATSILTALRTIVAEVAERPDAQPYDPKHERTTLRESIERKADNEIIERVTFTDFDHETREEIETFRLHMINGQLTTGPNGEPSIERISGRDGEKDEILVIFAEGDQIIPGLNGRPSAYLENERLQLTLPGPSGVLNYVQHYEDQPYPDKVISADLQFDATTGDTIITTATLLANQPISYGSHISAYIELREHYNEKGRLSDLENGECAVHTRLGTITRQTTNTKTHEDKPQPVVAWDAVHEKSYHNGDHVKDYIGRDDAEILSQKEQSIGPER
jgi:hypothetical protein